MPKGVFSLIQGGNREVGQALVQHPLIKAVGFTGSLGGGRALFDLCARRPEPIPFFGELGSVNPMFLLPEAVAARGAENSAGWAASLTMGAGQFCTNPGIAVVETGPEGDAFVKAATEGLAATGPQTMLTDGIAKACKDGKARFDGRNAVRPVLTNDSEGRSAAPNFYETDAATYLQDNALGEEVFEPLGLVIRVAGPEDMETLARGFDGQLTATLHMDAGDTALAQRLMPVLERMAGRVLVNGFPTGVEVCDSMVHGGPYPASTNFGATSVGTLSIRRFLRPVCYQNLPDALLPGDLTFRGAAGNCPAASSCQTNSGVNWRACAKRGRAPRHPARRGLPTGSATDQDRARLRSSVLPGDALRRRQQVCTRQAVVTTPIEHENGVARIPDPPGLGIEIDRDALARFVPGAGA